MFPKNNNSIEYENTAMDVSASCSLEYYFQKFLLHFEVVSIHQKALMILQKHA